MDCIPLTCSMVLASLSYKLTLLWGHVQSCIYHISLARILVSTFKHSFPGSSHCGEAVSYSPAMEYSRLVFLLLLILISLSLASVQSQPCSNRGTYSNNSTYSQNLNLILSSLSSNITANGGFYNTTAGQDPDKVYALALCRGDLASDTCYNCINSSTQDIINQCPNKKEALTWGDASTSTCMIRYSNRYIFAILEVAPVTCVPNPYNVTSFDQFNQTLIDLIARLVTQASSGSSSLKFATGDAYFTSSRKVYALVQCTPDLLQNDCRVCLQGAVGEIPTCCGGKEGGRVLRPSCLVWFELFQFYESNTVDTSVSLPPPTQVNSPLPPPNTSTRGNRSTTSRTVIIVVVPTVILVILSILTCAILQKSKWKWKLKQNDNNDDDMKKLESLQFNFRTIRAASDDFCDANKLGQGGFGSVYKGRLSNGQEIAVKRLSGYSEQGETEFKNEILLMAKLQHRNLVSLLGFCLEGRERILIYEFMGNGSLDHFIFDPIKCAELNWEKRYKIICGIARGILYLHEDSRLRIIHRDLKASNILLDEEMNAKISDFGMARLFVVDQTQGNTNKIAGTFGYMAPEYVAHGRFSVKSDVFSFGVLILEIVSGKKNSWYCNSEDVEHLISYAWKNWREGTALNLIDPTLGSSSRSEILRCIHIGLLCVQENIADRPTMAAVVLMLSSHSFSLPLPSHPAFLLHSDTESGLPQLEHSSGIAELEQSTYGTEYFSVQ